MLRRSHKKSRGGCVQCKRRHVKCDERRPVCVLCTMSNRDCSYTTEAKASPQKSSPRLSSQTEIPSPHEPIDEDLNLKHMELLIHLTTTNEMFNLGDDLGPYRTGIRFGLKRGLESPYLLYACLAFSARHLAYLHPERSAEFMHQAVTMQTRAITLFNIDEIQVDQSNCVAVLLFSAVVGHHLLADTLMERSPDGLDGFLTRYVQCANTHRGLYTITITAQPLLMETELEPVLSRSMNFTSKVPEGGHCDQIRSLVAHSNGLTHGEKEACQQALRYIQLGLDALSYPPENQNMRFQMLFLWTVLVPSEFIALLETKRLEALAILAYYALLLHHGRHMWQVGGSGEYILGLIERYLGPNRGDWLDYPHRGIIGCFQ
ncbi:hypothetical protein BJX63DRAFT_371429 [Aspergillus granulosus]|uniref:Zn(2)-C6 fungal-type domain-containing protein n=1 Tax=Aspergillus granulosus TaxID=176169 RepID=A0ABR4H2V5_9EURO